jgi:hypothetical protein
LKEEKFKVRKEHQVSRHNWDKIIADLWNKPGEWILVAEQISNGYADNRLRKAGMELKREKITGKLYDLYARWPGPGESHINIAALELASRIEDARQDVVLAETELREAQQLYREREDHYLAKQAALHALLNQGLEGRTQ